MIARFFITVIILGLSLKASANNLEEMIGDLIIEKLGSQVTEIELKFDSKIKLQEAISYGNQIKTVQLVYFAPNYSTFRVGVTSNQDTSVELSGRYLAYIATPVTIRNIAQGSIITNSDVNTTRTPLSKMKGGYIDSIEQVIGMQARRNISTGVLIRSSDLSKPTLIRQNDAVSIMYNSNNIKLRTVGIALESGAIGDNIKVKNESTGIIVHGTVKGKNLVEVSGE